VAEHFSIPRAARDRILETAGALFYQHGFHAVGIDTIVAASGVAKMTLYRHFPSKDDLIGACVERAHQEFWAWLNRAVEGVEEPRRRLLAIFEAVAALATSSHCLGCTFQAVAVEFPEPEHPGHRVAVAHKQAIVDELRTLAAAAGLQAPDALAQQLLLLMDGVWVAARMFGPHHPASPARQAPRAAEALIAAAATAG
jgi:AcrR family transcriptional regulator